MATATKRKAAPTGKAAAPAKPALKVPKVKTQSPEDLQLLRSARAAARDAKLNGTIPYDDLRHELGLT